MSPASTLRLFIALWPTEAIREAIAAWQVRWQWPPRATVVARGDLHLTLHFLGDVPAAHVGDLRYVLEKLRVPPFELHFGRPELWPRGVAVLRPDRLPRVLAALQGRIGLALGEIGLPLEDRAFRPHVTLARRATGAVAPVEAADIDWPGRGFVLARSLPGGRGYEVLERFG